MSQVDTGARIGYAGAMDRAELAERYLKIAEHLSGRELHQLLDRVEDLLSLRPAFDTQGVAIPSTRTLITPEGANVVYRDGRRSTIKRAAPRASKPKPELEIDIEKLPRRTHGTGSIKTASTHRGVRYVAEVHIGGDRHRAVFDTYIEAEKFLDALLTNAGRTPSDSVADLMDEACPLTPDVAVLTPPILAEALPVKDGLWAAAKDMNAYGTR